MFVATHISCEAEEENPSTAPHRVYVLPAVSVIDVTGDDGGPLYTCDATMIVLPVVVVSAGNASSVVPLTAEKFVLLTYVIAGGSPPPAAVE